MDLSNQDPGSDGSRNAELTLFTRRRMAKERGRLDESVERGRMTVGHWKPETVRGGRVERK